MSIRYTDYVRLKTGQYQSVGKFGDDIYAYEMLTGITDTPEYHQISKQEFDSFEIWSQAGPEYKKMYELLARSVLCSGYLGRAYLDTSLLRDL
ncbi:hypothetical protein [Paenibacillus campi]|uniref:hypothetical protein n=1 Tax=Paenibacillus campi TaxID=3106031 RepID=UPI002AFF1F46|nr:hypothetical protein [Paenibacillus sp. SGZ-1014]